MNDSSFILIGLAVVIAGILILLGRTKAEDVLSSDDKAKNAGSPVNQMYMNTARKIIADSESFNRDVEAFGLKDFTYVIEGNHSAPLVWVRIGCWPHATIYIELARTASRGNKNFAFNLLRVFREIGRNAEINFDIAPPTNIQQSIIN